LAKSIDHVDNVILKLVFPHTNHTPTVSAKPAKITLITLAGLLDLLPPKPRKLVAPKRKPPTVPEVPINEYGDLLRGEYDVRLAR
jgi:hypothetical protein